MENLLVGVLIVIILSNICSGLLRDNGRYNVHQEPPYEMNDFKSGISLTIDKHFISQKLDHFNPQNLRTWKMQYMENKIFSTHGEFYNNFVIEEKQLKLLVRWSNFHVCWW